MKELTKLRQLTIREADASTERELGRKSMVDRPYEVKVGGASSPKLKPTFEQWWRDLGAAKAEEYEQTAKTRFKEIALIVWHEAQRLK